MRPTTRLVKAAFGFCAYPSTYRPLSRVETFLGRIRAIPKKMVSWPHPLCSTPSQEVSMLYRVLIYSVLWTFAAISLAMTLYGALFASEYLLIGAFFLVTSAVTFVGMMTGAPHLGVTKSRQG